VAFSKGLGCEIMMISPWEKKHLADIIATM